MSWVDSLSQMADEYLDALNGFDFSTCYNDPVLFARECIDWERVKKSDGLTPYQEDILGLLITKGRVAVRGPHGLGKTAIQAILVLWFSLTRDQAEVDWKIATTAGAWRQLEKFLWPEISKWSKFIIWEKVGRKPFNTNTEMLTIMLKLNHGSAFAAASNKPELIEGVHADEVLYVFDESKAIPAEVFDAAEGAFTGGEGKAYALATSTPGVPSGRFYDIHRRAPGFEDWATRHVTLKEVMTAGQVDESWVNARKLQWGEESGVYHNRVLGEFHSDDEDGVIPLAWVEAAVKRWEDWDEAGRPELDGTRTIGVDVAREGNDKTVFATRIGPCITDLKDFSKQDTMVTANHLTALVSDGSLPIIDVVGVGGGVFDRLRELKIPVEGFGASNGTDRKDRSGKYGFVNCRSAAWWHMREILDPAFGSEIMLPPNDDLLGDLVKPTWKIAAGGRYQVESKDEIKKRNNGKSTDFGDAVIQAFWEGNVGANEWINHLKKKVERPEEVPVVTPEDDRETLRQKQFAAQRAANSRRGFRY